MHNPTGIPMPIQDGNMTRIIMPDQTIILKNPIRRTEKAEKRLEDPRQNFQTESFGVVYANELAAAEFEKPNPRFPVGAIIVRERNAATDSQTPEAVIAMVKREKGFSKKTGDWEFFTFNGADLKLQKRETKGDCATCHAGVKESDWIFRNYLQK